MPVTLVTDSGCDITRSEAAALGLEIVPIWIIFGEERFRDGIDIDRATFFKRLGAGEQPKTEPPTQEEFRTVFERVVNAGNEVVCVTLSSGISQCFANARAAATSFGERVAVVDSLGASGLETLLVKYANDLAKPGGSAQEIAKRIAPRALKYAAYFAVPDLTMLGRSGRLPKAMVALGSMLNVSLVLKMNEQGAIGPAGQSFAFEKTCEIMVDAVVRAIEHSPGARVAFGHVQAPDTAEKLRKLLEEKLGHPPAQEQVNEATLTLSAHMGPGAVGVFAIVP